MGGIALPAEGGIGSKS